MSIGLVRKEIHNIPYDVFNEGKEGNVYFGVGLVVKDLYIVSVRDDILGDRNDIIFITAYEGNGVVIKIVGNVRTYTKVLVINEAKKGHIISPNGHIIGVTVIGVLRVCKGDGIGIILFPYVPRWVGVA